MSTVNVQTFVISRDRVDLYQELLDLFDGIDTVRVVLDRRSGARAMNSDYMLLMDNEA